MRSSAHKVLITGGAKGIGLALARKFHGAGNDVTIVGRDRGALDSVSSQLADVMTIQADITTPEGIEAVADRAAETSVLVNNAGVQYTGEFLESPSAAIDREVQTNLLAPLHLVSRFLPALLEHNEAAIINMTSILAIVPKQSAPRILRDQGGSQKLQPLVAMAARGIVRSRFRSRSACRGHGYDSGEGERQDPTRSCGG